MLERITTEFTPGPWEVETNSDHLGILTQAGDIIVDHRGLGPHEILECFANACLAAAAPDLYAALAQYAILGHGKCSIGKPAADMALAALAKARGEK